MNRKTTMLATSLIAAVLLANTAAATTESHELTQQNWSFNGIRGKWDKAEILRGYTVATQVCLACHSFKYISHRDLMKVGFTEDEVKSMATALNMKPTDKMMSGMDDATAQATYAKTLPDLSTVVKARHSGADYIYALLTGYETAPSGTIVPEGGSYNKAFAAGNHIIAMPAPLNAEGQVTYTDGTSATIPQMAHDVTTFMAWAAEPELQERKATGVYVLLYLAIFSVLTFLLKRTIWKDVK